MGKYDAVLPKQKLQDLSPRQAEIDRIKLDYPHRDDPTRLATLYADLRREHDLLKEKLSGNQLLIDAVSQLLVASQEAGHEGWGQYGASKSTLRLSSGASIRVQPEPVGKVVDKEAFRQWCVENGYEAQLQLWPSTMNAIVKERLLSGEPEPDGTESYTYDKIVYTAAKEGEED